MKTNLYIFILLWITIFTFDLSAAWLSNIEMQLFQPDGTELLLFASGDEYHNWIHDQNDYTVIQDPQSGFWSWAKLEEGQLVSSGYPVHLYSPQSLGLEPKLNLSETQYLEKRALKDNYSLTRNSTPSLGMVCNLVIFIRFADQPEFLNNAFNTFTNYYLADEDNASSVFKYYYDASFGNLFMISHFFPFPENDLIVSFQDEYPRNYYMPYNAATNPNGYTTGNENSRKNALMTAAINYVATQVPTSLLLDSNNNGEVDNTTFLIRGTPAGWNDLLWPHKSTWTGSAKINNKSIRTYNFNIETEANASVLCHELGHSMGLPDYYRYYITDITPVGMWCLMASNASTMQSINAHARSRYLQWEASPMPVASTSGTYTLYPITIDPYNHALRINLPGANEFLVVEYRSNVTGKTDSSLPYSGLLISRVNTSYQGNAGSQTQARDELYYFRVNGTSTSTTSIDGNINSAMFSSGLNRTAFHEYSNPKAHLFNGNLIDQVRIFNIGQAGESITFDLDFEGPDSNYFTESFETQDFNNHDWFLSGNSNWVITSDSASHGQYSATAPSVENSFPSRLEMEAILDGGYVQFWFRTQTATNRGFLRFYLDNYQINSWTGSNNWQFFAYPIESGLHSLAWVYDKIDNNPAPTDQVWVDQIGFPSVTGFILYPPLNLSALAVDRDITINWVPPYQTVYPEKPTLLGYNLLQNGGTPINQELIINTSFVIQNSAGGNLTFYVVAKYTEGDSEMSEPITYNLQPLGTPSNLRATQIGPSSVRIDWDFNYTSYNIAGYRIGKNSVVGYATVLASLGILSYTDERDLELGETYTYEVRAIYTLPVAISEPSLPCEIMITVSEDDFTNPYTQTELMNNYPNPFNPETIISFYLKEKSHVLLEVYNIKGELVRTLVNKEFEPGKRNIVWNGKDNQHQMTASGVYFYRMQSMGYESIKKMILLK